MRKKNELSQEDQAFFLEAMRGVKKIAYSKAHFPPEPPTKPKAPAQISQAKPDLFYFSDYDKIDLVDSHESIEFSRPGIQHKILRKLRLGQYNIEAKLDLHGQTVEQAKQSLAEFFIDCQKQGIRHVLIIHGKGRSHLKPILKNKLNHWLRETNLVLAFSSAIAKDGSRGALYVLLRRE